MHTVDGPKKMKFEVADATAGVPDEIKDTPIGPMIGVAAIALNMAMKYHDISTVQDGQLYQQYKLEGRNMVPLELDMVFDTAMQIEAHLISANKRVTRLMIAAVLDEGEAEQSDEGAVPSVPDDTQ